ncbi:MAG: ROK family protein, partial [Bacteroidales bacterium]|nr:ROK family protein [Bacteroidales bacterium]
MKEVVAGVDIGGTNTVSGLVDRDGNVLAVDDLKTTEYPDIKDFISNLAASVNRMLSKDKSLKL